MQSKKPSLVNQKSHRQDRISWILIAGFYNSYSLASNFTQPYQDEIPDEILFSVNSDFIAEGEEDLVQVNFNCCIQHLQYSI